MFRLYLTFAYAVQRFGRVKIGFYKQRLFEKFIPGIGVKRRLIDINFLQFLFETDFVNCDLFPEEILIFNSFNIGIVCFKLILWALCEYLFSFLNT